MKKFNAHILVVDDDDGIRDLVKQYLNQNNFLVSTSNSAEDAYEKIKVIKFDLIILDIMMPGKTGLQFLKEIRQNSRVPILMLTAMSSPENRLDGLEGGADDYMTKPFDSEVLLAKIKATLNRNKKSFIPDNNIFEFDFSDFNFNSKLRILTYKDGDLIKLSPKENQLLRLLVLHINDLLPRETALNKIWRDDNYFTSRSMDVYIAKLRKQLQKDPNVSINNIHGEGFRLIVE